jgi:hypothetical protein
MQDRRRQWQPEIKGEIRRYLLAIMTLRSSSGIHAVRTADNWSLAGAANPIDHAVFTNR